MNMTEFTGANIGTHKLGVDITANFAYPNTPDAYGQYPGFKTLTTSNQRPYFREVNRRYANRSFRFFNPIDYAVQGLWEADQAIKNSEFVNHRWSATSTPVANSFYIGDQTTQWFPADTHEIFSYGAEGRIGLGVTPIGSMSAGLFGGFYELDMNADFGFDETHKWHSAQFNGNLSENFADGRGALWRYWVQFLKANNVNDNVNSR